VNGTVAEARGGHSPEEWRLRLMEAKALGNTEVRKRILYILKGRAGSGYTEAEGCTLQYRIH
jgi:hypothetical protein